MRLVEAELSLESFASGKRIKELGMPSVGSAMILAVCRGGMTFFDPGPEAPLFPGDRVMILGEEKEAKAAAELLSKEKYGRGNVGTDGEFCIHQAVVNDASILHGETLAGSNVRRRFSISIIGIEREGLRNVSPKASDIIQQGDVLLVAGNAHSVERFGKEAGCRLLSMEPKQDRVTSESDHIAGHALD